MSNPFVVFPWNRPFLPDLKDYIAQQTGGRPGQSLIIIPNQRPYRYLADLYAAEKKAAVIPRILPFARVATIWSAANAAAPYCTANLLDQVALARDAVGELAREDERLSACFAGQEMAAFLPWGQHLVSLFEDMFLEGIEPRDMECMEGEVAPLAAALLSALGRISARYRQKLEQSSPMLKTAGLESLAAAQSADRIPASLLPRPDRPVFIAGFSLLNGVENRLFHALWQAGATICLHADPALASKEKPHEACRPLAEWLERWQATAEIYRDAGRKAEPQCSFYAAYDSHSQLSRLATDLEQCEAESANASNAVILPEPGLLMPTLHHLRDRDLNISMGYPLERAQLSGLLDDIFTLQIGKSSESGKYYWHTLLRLLRQPFLAIIKAGEKREVDLYKALALMDRAIRTGASKYVDLEALKNEVAFELTAAEATLLFSAIEVTVEQFANVGTLAELAGAFEALCNFLISHGGKGWRRFPLEAEALARLQNRVLPVLRDNLLKQENFPISVLYGFLQTLLTQERIAFKPDSLVASQILGLLETRLLNFDNLFILDATDDKMPGGAAQDPLLPDGMRKLIDLPDAERRRKAAAYNLYRLMAGAKKVFFYWPQGATASGGRAYRSRFVEQLIWDEEKKRGSLLKPGMGPYDVAKATAHPGRRIDAPIPGDPALADKMRDLLGGSLSPSLLDGYLRCPAAFVMQRIMRLGAPMEVNEGDDNMRAGDCVHNALRNFLAPHKDRTLCLCDLPFDGLRARFRDELEQNKMEDLLPADSYIMLEQIGERQLKRYLEKQKNATIIRELEKPVTAQLEFNGQKYLFEGRIDRLDEREGQAVILDYKSGSSVPEPVEGFWSKQALFDRLEQYTRDNDQFDSKGDELLAELLVNLPSVQLPVYLLMLEALTGATPGDAAFVELGASCDEISLFKGLDADQRARALENCRIMLGFILAHMERTPHFARLRQKCSYCKFSSACQI